MTLTEIPMCNFIATSEKGPKNQIPSMGCSIKWFK